MGHGVTQTALQHPWSCPPPPSPNPRSSLFMGLHPDNTRRRIWTCSTRAWMVTKTLSLTVPALPQLSSCTDPLQAETLKVPFFFSPPSHHIFFYLNPRLRKPLSTAALALSRRRDLRRALGGDKPDLSAADVRGGAKPSHHWGFRHRGWCFLLKSQRPWAYK